MWKNSHSMNLIKNASLGCLKATFSTIPLMNSIIGAWDGISNARIEDGINQLSAGIKKLGEEKIDKKFIESEEFFDLFSKAVRIRFQTRSKMRAKLIDGLLIESITKDRDQRFSTALKESFLISLDKLSDEALIFLHNYSNGKYAKKSQDDIYQIGDKESISLDELFAEEILRTNSAWNQHITETMRGREFIAYLKLLSREECA